MQLFPAEIAIPQYLREQPLADALIAMHRNHRAAAIIMPQEMVAAFDPHDDEPDALQGLD
ncbi:hypothetical protein LDFHOB_05765 [Candidatus Electronema aureum]